MQVPASFLQQEHGSGGDEFDIVRMGEEGEDGRHGGGLLEGSCSVFRGRRLQVGGAHGLAAEFGAAVRREHDFEGFEGLAEAGPLHFFAFIQRVEELLELGLIRVIADIAAIEHFHGEIAPCGFVGLEFIGVEFIVEQAAFAADEVGVEVVGLEAIDNGRAFADGAVFELHDGDARGVVFVGGEDFAFGLGGEAGDGIDLIAHAEEQGVEGVATRGEEGAATVFFAGVPAELAIPGADAMIIIDFGIVQGAEETLVDHRASADELA